ncbi:hypothetical protein BDV18DRAFT_109826 [Aspergillus unguis]
MKFSLAALALTVAGALAAPAPTIKRQDAGHPYSIDSISLKRLEDNTFNINLSVGWWSETGEIKESTTCFTEWNPTPPPTAPVACADPNFTFWFPTGIKNLEEYDVAVNGPDGQAQGHVVKGPKYECDTYTGPIEGVIYECKIINGGRFVLSLD